jgi:PAS domain S-box-containing protein
MEDFTSGNKLNDLLTAADKMQSGNGLTDGKSPGNRRSGNHNSLDYLQNDFFTSGELPYQQVIQALPIAIYMCDTDGRITLFNDAAAALWGRVPEIGKDLWCGSWKIFSPDGVPVPLDTCPMAIAIKEGRAVTGKEIIVETIDGTRRNVVPHPKPIFNRSGKLIGAINMLVDVTEARKTTRALLESEKKYRQLAGSLEKIVQAKTKDLQQKNEDLRKSEERYHKMIEEVEDYAIILLDSDGNIMNWNKGAEKIKGYKEKEIIGKNFRIFYQEVDRKNKLPEKLINTAIREGKAMHEGWRVRSNGTRFWGSIVITALHDNDNNIIGFSKVTRDLTEKKAADDKLREYATKLEFQNNELEQFAYVASHDMKEPLRKIQFYNNYIFENVYDRLTEKERDFLNRSMNASSRMQILIDDLLSYSKTGRDLHHFESVDLNEILREAMVLHSDTIDEVKAEIESDELPEIKGISFQLIQLFDNLIGNSLKYRHSSRIPRLRVTCERVDSHDIKDNSIESDKQFYKISFKDNGIGFESQYSGKIFDLFQRLHSRADYSGSGIGLAICKKIVQNHHGFMDATGELNEGATFFVYFPVY